MALRQIVKNRYMLGILVGVLTGCNQSVLPMDKAEIANQRNQRGINNEIIITTAPDSNGRESASYDPGAADNHVIQTNSPSLGGATVTMVPGALEVPAQIIIEEGSPLHESVLSELAISDVTQVSQAAQGIIVRSDQDVMLQKPMVLEIPMPATGFWANLLQEDPYQNVVILYRIQDQASPTGLVSGLMPRSQFEVGDNLARFQAPGFGEYQAVNLVQPVTSAKEVVTTEPVVTIRNEPVLTSTKTDEIDTDGDDGEVLDPDPVPETSDPVDSTPPEVTSFVLANGASDGYINATEYLSPLPLVNLIPNETVTDQFSAVLPNTSLICDDSRAYPNADIPMIADIPGNDGAFAVCVKLTDAGGNVSYTKSPAVVRDITAPVFISLSPANEAADSWISATEASSSLAFVSLNASGYTTVLYTAITDETTPVTCDSSRTYGNASPPPIQSIAEPNGTFSLCAQLTDDAGNRTFGKSSLVTKDSIPPIFTSLSGANEAVDGLVTSAEVASLSPLVALNATGYDNVSYTSVLSDASLTCDAGRTYGQTIPTIASLPASDGAYAVCVKLMDTSGNKTYGKSQQIVRDVSPPAGVSISGAPSGTNNAVSLNIAISGVDVTQYKFKVGVAASLDCAMATGYGPATSATTNIAENIGVLPDGSLRLCVIGGDVHGNFTNPANATVATWVKDTTPPVTAESIAATPSNSEVSVSWTSTAADAAGFVLLRNSTCSASLTQGVVYTAGATVGSGTILYVGSSLSHKDATAINGSSYGYQVFTFDGLYNYDVGACATTSLANNQIPINKFPHNHALLKSQTPTFVARNTSNTGGLFKYHWETTLDGFVNVTSQYLSNVASASDASLLSMQSLTNLTQYQWRVRSSFNNGSTWSGYASPRYIRVNTSAPQDIWQVDTADALTAFFPSQSNMAVETTNTGEVSLASMALSGSMTSDAISLSDLGWERWGMLVPDIDFTQFTGNSMDFNLEYNSGGTWTVVPPALYTVSSGSITHWANLMLNNLDPSIYKTIRMVVTSTRASSMETPPMLRAISLTPAVAKTTLTNGGFESAIGNEWIVSRNYATGIFPTVNLKTNDGTARTGTYYAKIANVTGSIGHTREAYASQTLVIPADAAQLTFYYKRSTGNWGPVIRFYINNTVVFEILANGTAASTTTWTAQTINVASYAGQTVTFSFGILDAAEGAGNTDHAGWLAVDDITISP